MLPLSQGQRKLCFGETAYKACWDERCHRLLLLVDGVDIKSVTVDNDSTQKEKRKLINVNKRTDGSGTMKGKHFMYCDVCFK